VKGLGDWEGWSNGLGARVDGGGEVGRWGGKGWRGENGGVKGSIGKVVDIGVRERWIKRERSI